MKLTNVEDIYPLTPVQQGLLFHTLYAPGAGVYCTQVSFLIRGDLNSQALRQAWQQALERHPILRTAFVWEGLEQPLQVVHQQLSLPWLEEDWSALDAGEQDRRWGDYLDADWSRGFELSKAPLLRLALVRLSARSFRFLWSYHHLLLDGWSTSRVLEEVQSSYQFLGKDRMAGAPTARPYRDYLAWLQRQAPSQAEPFWRDMLRGCRAPTRLPLIEIPAGRAVSVGGYGSHELALSAEATAALQGFARRQQVSLNAVVQAAWALLLSKYSGEEEVVFGVTVSGRPLSLDGIEQMVGMFINTLPLRVRAAPDVDAATWIRQIHAQQTDLQPYEQSSLVEVQGWSEMPPASPLFESIYVFENYPVSRAGNDHPGAVEIRDIRTRERTNYPLSAVVLPGPRLRLKILHDRDRIDSGSVARMLKHWCNLLDGMVADPHCAVAKLPMLSADERRQIEIEWNRTDTAFPADRCIHELFEAQALSNPAAIALEFLDARMTYGELNARADQFARRLRELGVGPERPVALLLERSLDMLVALLGVLKAGGAYVPLASDDPDERLGWLLRDAAPAAVITQGAFAHRLISCACPVVRIDHDWPAIAACDSGTSPSRTTPDSLAYIIYTSGSTGEPKGVCVSHRSVVRLVKNTDFIRFDPSETFLQLAPLAFDASTFEIWGPLLNGGKLAVAPPQRLSPGDIGRCIRQHHVTTMWLTAGLFHVLVDEALEALRPLRQLVVGGDVLSVPHVLTAVRELDGCRIINGYGPTENTTFTCCYPVDDPGRIGTSIPIGRPIANTRVYIVDRHMQVVPIGVAGELCTSGAGLARGYLDRPELTRERFIDNPFEDPDPRLYRTGDICRYLPDGNIEILGRTDTQVKIRGFRVELGEVETALVSRAEIRQAAVVNAGGRLAAYLVAAPGATIDTAEIARDLARTLPDYMVPAAFALLDQMPLTANGKVDRALLPEIAHSAEVDLAAPATPTQEIIAAIWARTLGLDAVGTASNFFELGGHSLLATRVVSRLREAFGIELPLRLLFQSPTVTGLAEHVETARRQSMPASPPMRRDAPAGAMALSFAQERLWFLHQLEPDNPFYNVPLVLSLKGRLDVRALQDSVNAIVRRHEVLRTSFAGIDGRPMQIVADNWESDLPIVDLGGLPGQSRMEEADRLIAAESRKPFDLGRHALRARLFRLDDAHHLFLFNVHHIVADGWSLGVLINELAVAYRFYRSGGAPIETLLPALPIQYADFAAWQRNWLQGDVLERQLAYWKTRLGDAPRVLDLPTDRPRPPVQSYEGASVHFQIDPAIADALRALSRRSASTLFMTLLSTFATLLYRYGGQHDMVIGSPIANRTHGEIEPLIGFFVNTLAMRVDLRGNPPFQELLARVREIALDAYDHQDLPFEKLVDELQPERDLSLNPLFQVMFALHNAPIDRFELPELSAELLDSRHQAALFDLVLDMWETEGTLHGVLEYNTDLFDQDSVRRIVSNLQTLLASVAADAAVRLDDLPLLTSQEQNALLQLGSGPRRSYPVEQTIHTLFEQTAAQNAARIAAVHNGSRITYGELDARSNRIAHRLRRLGVKANDFVGILDHRGIDVLAAMLGILKAGAAFVPLDPAYPAERLRHMLADSCVQVLISRAATLAQLPAGAYGGHTLLLDRDNWEQEPAAPLNSLSGATDLAYMLYTSGSTGLPKGAMVRHNGAINHIFAEFELLAFDAETAFLQSAPSSSDISVWQFLAPVLIGGRVVIADYETMCEPAALFRLIRTESVTLIELVPLVMKGLLDHVAYLPRNNRALPRLAFAMVTGEAATPALINLWLETYPAVTLINAYGPTEAADDICQAVLERPLAPECRTVPIGRPLANLTLYVLDRNLRLLPCGVPGEICVSGIAVGAGYWHDEARTRASFVTNPYAADRHDAIVYRTGDLGRWLPDGTLECLNRIDQQIKLRGFRIELGEIEAILGAHPAVRDAAAAIHQGDGESQLAAYVVADTASAEVANHLEDLRREQIGLWQDLHEDSYRGELLRGDPTFNVIGWDSNYTGLPLPEADMREYVAFTAERVLALQPRHVLEIGCGTGLIMFSLLPHCASYTGMDLSGVAIRRLRELQKQPQLRARFPGLESAELFCRRADETDWIQPNRYDTVVLPSVVQYFPGIEYLLQVLENVFSVALAPGGSIFIGDVRSLPLLEAFHASVQLYKAAPSERSAEVARRARRSLAQEQELAIDPAFFLALKQRFPAIRHVEIVPKRGTQHNEMTRFRYDVVIRTGDTAAAAGLPWVDWRQGRPGIEQLRRRLSQERPAVLALRDVANRRVADALAAVECLFGGNDAVPAAELKASVAHSADDGIEPEDLWRLADECRYRVDISLASGYRDGSFDAAFRLIEGNALAPLAWQTDGLQKPWSGFANNPLLEKLGRRLAPVLRETLKQMLPHYMVPAAVTLLPYLPLTPSGKVDRQALPAPDLSERIAEGAYVAPRTHEEQVLARLWAEILGLTRVGIHNNFFELGGHSLKATQVISRIHRELGVQIPLRDLFSHPTIAELAPKLVCEKTTAFAAIAQAPEADHYPLSHGQRRLWILSQLEGGSTAYNLPMALLLEGPIDPAIFGQAYARLIDRHELLRTSFIVVDGEPRQRILPAAGAKLEIVDLTRDPHAEQVARDRALADAAAPFDLERGPVRASLLQLGRHRFVLLLNMHHVVSDDWSQNVFTSEFVKLYTALARGEDGALPPLRLQYRDYACWQHDYLAGPVAAAHRDYWHAKLAGELPVLDLPADLPRPPIKTYRGDNFGTSLDAEQAARLGALARTHGASLFMALVAIVKILLFRYTGKDEILLGFPISGRTHADLEDQIGFYVNTLPLRDRIQAEDSFFALLDRIKVTATEAYDHQDYPFDRLVDELNVARDVSRSPMFDVVVIMQNAAAAATPLSDIRVAAFVRRYDMAKFDLSFTFEERRDGTLQVDVSYNTDLFLPARIKRMAGHFQELTASVLRDPTLALTRMPMLSVAERRQVLSIGVSAPASPRDETVVALFERQAALRPDDVALILPARSEEVDAGPRQTMSYRELNARANLVAHRLREFGVGPDMVVGLCVPRSLDLVVGLLAILKAGGAYLPLDTAHPPERWAFMLDDAQAGVVVTLDALAQKLGANWPTLCLDRDGAAPARENLPIQAEADHLAYVIYTSGSIGRPKGVAVTHRNVARLFTASAPLFGFGASDVWTLFHSCAFDFSVWELWGPLLHGGRLVVVPYWVTRSPNAFYDVLAQEGVTVLNQTPSAFRQLMQVEDDANARRALALRTVIFGGEALEFASLRPWFARHGDTTPRLINMYGITETTVHVTFRAVTMADLETTGSRIGQPLPDLGLYLLDANREPVPIGVPGELYVAGGGVARGYLHRAGLTAERFVQNPFDSDPQSRLYRTGDLARLLPDGDIEYLGRIDQQIQIRGFRVELGEIEASLGSCPGIRAALVLADGQGAEMRLIGYFVAAGDPPGSATLRRHLQSSLPDYMVPAAFIAVPAFPLTANGKLDRAALLSLTGGRPATDVSYAAPQDDMERLLASLFADALGIDRVGVHDNFFDLGANSLMLIKVHRQLRDRLAQKISVIRLFQFPTVASLARELVGQPFAPSLDPQAVDERVARRKAARDRRASLRASVPAEP